MIIKLFYYNICPLLKCNGQISFTNNSIKKKKSQMNQTLKIALIAVLVYLVMKALDRFFLDGMIWDKFGSFEAEE